MNLAIPLVDDRENKRRGRRTEVIRQQVVTLSRPQITSQEAGALAIRFPELLDRIIALRIVEP